MTAGLLESAKEQIHTAMLCDCKCQVAGKAPAVPTPLPPNLPPAANADSRHQRAMMENRSKDDKRKLKVALDDLNLDVTALQEDFTKVPKWSESEDHHVIAGMAAKKGWSKSLRDHGKKFNERSIMETFLYTQSWLP